MCKRCSLFALLPDPFVGCFRCGSSGKLPTSLGEGPVRGCDNLVTETTYEAVKAMVTDLCESLVVLLFGCRDKFLGKGFDAVASVRQSRKNK